MGDTATGSWGSRELGGYIRREEGVTDWERRVRNLEGAGLTRSDAQAVVDAQEFKAQEEQDAFQTLLATAHANQQKKRYFDNPNDPTQTEALELAYDTVHAILTQWEEKQLAGDFFTTPMDLHETLAFLGYGREAGHRIVCTCNPKCSSVEYCDGWKCLNCGNMAHLDGFHPCDEHGREMEPVEGWKGLYVCGRCGNAYEQRTGKRYFTSEDLAA